MRIRFTPTFLTAWTATIALACGSPSLGDTQDDGSTADAGRIDSEDAGVVPDEDAGPVEHRADAGAADDHADAGGSHDSPDAGPPDTGSTSTRGVRVVGNRLEKDGAPLQIRGVNRSGTEYACVQGGVVFEGPSDDASIEAIASWGANAIRIPMNETCWLGINGVAPSASGAAYQDAILAYVRRIEAHGLTPILDLHWTAPGGSQATDQVPMPDADHSRDFWRQVAARVADDPYVVLELFNEPWPDYNNDSDAAWRCWRDGGTCPGVSYQAAGMQQLVDDVRSAGAKNVILLGGIRFASTLTQWLEHMPHDPLEQLGAAWHVYPIGLCSTAECFDASPAAVSAVVPIVATEIGEEDCSGSFMNTVMSWLDAHGDGYLAWTWNTWGRCMVLIDDYAGTPRGAYGTTYRDHLQSRAR